MDGLAERLLGLVPGALMAVLGAYMAASGNYRLLHGYHYATTPEARRPRLARELGASTVVLGAGVALVVPGWMPDWAVLAGVALLAGGLVAMVALIVRENGGLVTAVAGAPLGLGPRASAAACVVVGALLSLVGFVPGALMIATGDVSVLHGYHVANVPASDIPAMAAWEGAAMLCLGASILVCAVGCAGAAARRPAPSWARALQVAGAALLAASIVASLLVIVRFNGSLMG